MAGSFFGRLGATGRPAAVLPDHLVLSGRTIPLVVREHPNARRIVMRLAPGGTAVRLTVPRRTSTRVILSFLQRHQGWADERLATAPPARRIEPGTLLPLRGESWRLAHEPGARGVRAETDGEEPCLVFGGEAAHLPRRVRDWLRREARADLQDAVDRHAATVGLSPRALTLKDTTSRWGSCTADRRLSFSWRIVMAPPVALDYLAAHEVAHFREMNHGPAFWALCRSLCPTMDAGRDWLKTDGSRLHAYDFSA